MNMVSTTHPHREIRALMDRFGYPQELEEKLVALRGILERACGSRLRSVLLGGSIASGDFVWLRGQAGVTLLSDIDAIAFVDGAVDRARIAGQLRELRRDRAATPLFHVDVSLSPAAGLQRLPRSFQAAEMRRAGWVLAGEDVRRCFPVAFDPATARQAFFYNLWKPFLFGALRETRPDLYQQAIARQILDVALLAFSESGVCIAGHRQRAQAFQDLPAEHALKTPAVRAALQDALLIRQGGSCNLETLEHEQRAAIQAVLHFLLARHGGQTTGPLTPRQIGRLLARRSWRQRAAEMRGELARHSLDPLWLLRRKEALAAAALLEIGRSCTPGSRAPAPPRARRWLSAFAGEPVPALAGEAFANAARGVYWRGLLRLHPGLCRDADWVEPLLRGEHA